MWTPKFASFVFRLRLFAGAGGNLNEACPLNEKLSSIGQWWEWGTLFQSATQRLMILNNTLSEWEAIGLAGSTNMTAVLARPSLIVRIGSLKNVVVQRARS
jgi:hypothetical protein